MKDRPVTTCDECRSLFFPETTAMAALCPACAHRLYGYPVCDHRFVAGRCAICHWDGSISEYCRAIEREDPD